MDFSRAFSYLCSLSTENKVLEGTSPYSLTAIKDVLYKFRNPEKRLKVIHVAGSKGKGSLCHLLASLLQSSGYNVGLFTSPHLVDVRERIQISGTMISKIDFGKISGQIIAMIGSSASRVSRPSSLTYFEFLTVLAILYFVQKHVDYAVFEVGLGGRLDATNIVHPIATVLTPIELEHTQILGDTVQQIAREKLGIVKKGVPLFVASQKKDVLSLCRDVCRKRNSLCFAVQDYVSSSILSRTIAGYSFRYTWRKFPKIDLFLDVCVKKPAIEEFTLSLRGDHQVKNACLALLLIHVLFPDTAHDVLQRGLTNVCVPARFEYTHIKDVPVIFDVAHTVESIRAFLKTYKQLFAYQPRVFVLSLLRDKAILDILILLFQNQHDVFVFTSSDSDRALKSADLLARFKKLSMPDTKLKYSFARLSLLSFDNPLTAFHQALVIAHARSSILCVIGSHYHIGQIKAPFS